jgi:response regulator RpfG family c-di-GMP phosphodiesterase
MKIRPCFLVVDNQYPGSLSTRKLVIETAQLNVITAYSGREALVQFARFPAVDGIVLDIEVPDIPCRELIDKLHKVRSDVPVVSVSPSGHDRCGNEQYHVSSYDPQALLDQLHLIVRGRQELAFGENGASGDTPA